MVRILKRGYKDPWTADFKKRDEGVHGLPIWSEFLKGVKGSMDRRFGTNSIGECRDSRTADLARVFQGGRRHPRTVDLVQILNGENGD